MDDYKYVLIEAVESLIEKAAAVENGVGLYDDGRKMAYFEALQAIGSVADEAGIDRAEIGLDRFDYAAAIGLKKAA